MFQKKYFDYTEMGGMAPPCPPLATALAVSRNLLQV